jgi:hypothetical protein
VPAETYEWLMDVVDDYELGKVGFFLSSEILAEQSAKTCLMIITN